MAVLEDRLYVFLVDEAGGLIYSSFDGSLFSLWTRVPGDLQFTDSVAATIFADHIILFARNTTNGVVVQNAFDGASFLGWSPVRGESVSTVSPLLRCTLVSM